MAKRRSAKKKPSAILGIIVLIIVLITGYFGTETEQGEHTNSYLGDGEAYIHFIDVGQGSATLIQLDRSGILIDTGEAEYSESLISYIGSCGVETLEYVVASHPHSDHIGGMTDVFKNSVVGTVLMPELSEINIPTTRLYERFLTFIDENNMSVEFPDVGDTYKLGPVTMTIMGPVEQSEDLNNMSLICKVDAYGTDIMVLGDAEKEELSSVYKKTSGDWKSDILVMGHHGSSTSVHKSFLNNVDADVAIISCGRDNSYGHPHREALEYVNDKGLELYRTDYDGTIVFRCDADGYEKVD